MTGLAALATAPMLVLVGCGGGGEGDGEGEGDGGTTSLTLAHSYNDNQPQVECGVDLIEEEVASADVGLEIESYGSSQLGGDSDRIASVTSGDIDIDIQGASALGSVHEPVSIFDAAYVFDDADHLEEFMDSDDSDPVIESFAEETGIHTLGVWSAGARHFTADEAIRSPEDLSGLRIRFPGSPQYLMNAEALGANATEVAYEELYLSLQQGAVDGQENPITNIESESLNEVQDYLSLSSHQLNTNLVIIGSVWDELDEEQQEVLTSAVENAVTEVTECVADEEEEVLDEWRDGGEWEVVDDVDVEAFQDQALEHFEENLEGESREVFDAIRGTADQ
ncbi:MAG: DctP family TRAP transporter solute-binding subunit [Nesterenkonia sp.]|nr:DctP family TRAP transporter solute-binding subunit [Nesterenkonia sp.]